MESGGHILSTDKNISTELQQRNEQLQRENSSLKYRLNGFQTLAALLNESENTDKHLKHEIEILHASQKASVRNCVGEGPNADKGDQSTVQSTGSVVHANPWSVHSEEFRSDIRSRISESQHQSRTASNTSNTSAAEIVEVPTGAAAAAEPRDIDRYGSLPSVRSHQDGQANSSLATTLASTNMPVVTIDRENAATMGKVMMLTTPPKPPDDGNEMLKKRVHELEKQNKQIIHFNQAWNTHYQGMKAQIVDLQRQNQNKDSTIARLRSENDLIRRREKDVDRTLIDALKRVEVEGSARESAMEDLRLEKQRAETLVKRVAVLENKGTQLLKLNTGSENDTHPLDKTLVEDDIGALKVQLLCYKEDFEHERRDRERLALEVDKLKVQLENIQHERDMSAQKLYEEDFLCLQEENQRLQRMVRRDREPDYKFYRMPANSPRPVRAEKVRVVQRQADEYNYERDPYSSYGHGQYLKEQQVFQPLSSQDVQSTVGNQMPLPRTLMPPDQCGYQDDGFRYPQPEQNDLEMTL